ncbi:hypothetical protein [Chryseobacterium populi]|nr:hypothetical protein [Chryseobacterium populi]
MNTLINESSGNFTNLKKIINFLDMIPNASESQIDLVTHKILKHLENGALPEKIKGAIESELIITYGYYSFEFDVDRVTEEIMNWWERR